MAEYSRIRNGHSLITASKASQLTSCHASAHLDLAIPGWTPPDPQAPKVAADRGTNMHDLLEKSGDFTPKEQAGIARAMAYVAELRQKRRFTQLREETVEATWLKHKPKTTADVVLYTKDQLEIVDYKMGKIPVEVVDNSQLKYYAVTYGFLAPKAKGVTVHIVQPFADNIVSWWVSATELKTFAQECIDAEAAIDAGSVKFMPGSHCTFCPANPMMRGSKDAKGYPFCPAVLQMMHPDPTDLDEIAAMRDEMEE